MAPFYLQLFDAGLSFRNKMPPKAGVKRKAANGYKMPEKLDEGTVLTSLHKKQFRVGKSIG